MKQRQLYRSEVDRVIGGVAGGLGEFFEVDSNLIRIAFVFLGLVTAGILLYVACWILIPVAPSGEEKEQLEVKPRTWNSDATLALWFIGLGSILLLGNFHFLDFDWVFRFWPVILILIGWHFYTRSKS